MNAAPMPRWDVDLAWSAGDDPAALRAIPSALGVCAFENAAGATLMLAVSADVRRFVRTRLGVAGDSPSAMPAEAASDVRRILVQRAGSEFEADWAYLNHARIRLPGEYRLLLDRWPCFWIHADPSAQFPRWLKTAHPGRPPAGTRGAYLGPFPDKHAAGRFMESLDDAFNLCRYHHILVQAPHASACAYKEMGKCPAPCDGTISMDEYREQVRSAAAFVAHGVESSRAELDVRMKQAGDVRDFEAAAMLKARLERTAGMTKRSYRFVRDINNFRFLGVFASTRPGWRRLFLIVGGQVTPWSDLHEDVTLPGCELIINAVRDVEHRMQVSLEAPIVEGLGMIASHLFLPAGKAEGRFLRIDDELGAAMLRRAVRRPIHTDAVGDDHVIESVNQ